MAKAPNLRAVAAQCITDVMENGRSLSHVLSEHLSHVNERDRALLQEICYGVLRVQPQLEWIICQLMKKVMTGKQRVLHYLLMVGLYQLLYLRIPDHAVLSETVEATVPLKKIAFKKLINAILRSFLREKESLLRQFIEKGNTSLHPLWLTEKIKLAYPQQWQAIIEANNEKPPMWLRVNRLHHTAEEYLRLLEAQQIAGERDEQIPDAIRVLQPVAVSQLPGFSEGWVSVQDRSAQEAALWVNPTENENVLDLCAAPGGKTGHLLEIAPNANVMAVDSDQQRLKKVEENLHRLHLNAKVICGDGSQPNVWCQGNTFNKILIDAPCSGTGVIRRHPDIKWLRRASDIEELVSLQSTILDAIWPYLEENGELIYTTCSILPEENHLQIDAFLTRHQDAKLVGKVKQQLPQHQGGDGFFYAKLIKHAGQ